MKRIVLLTGISFWLSTAFTQTTEKIDSLMTALYSRGQFNGSILVSAGDNVIYRNGFGEANLTSHQKFDPSTVSCLASLSKQFTATIIMMLAEQNKINYDDPVPKYLPEISKLAKNITIRHLLTHTSGIPDVGDLGIDNPRLTNEIALKILMKFDSTMVKPGLKYKYSNTGYMLLATIAERVSGKPFRDLLNEKILQPLKMSNTFLDEGKKPKPKNVAVSYSQYGDFSDYNGLTTGMSGMYSNVDDLLKWKNGLFSGKLIPGSALDIAFTPYQPKEGNSTYGFAWNIIPMDGDKFVWHTGSTEGFRAFLGVLLNEKVSVIILTNKGNSPRMEISNAVINIIHGKPYALPKMSVAEKLYAHIQKQGLSQSVGLYKTLKASDFDSYNFGEGELNSLGYKLMSEKKIKEAIAFFELNTLSYPSSSNAFDSLAEAYASAGNKDLAIKYYRKAIELDPGNLNSINMLKKLSK